MKLKKIIILIVLTIAATSTLFSCKSRNKDDSFTLEAPNSIYMGDASLENFYIVEGNKKTSVTKDMLTSGSELLFYQEGSQTFEITYNNVKKSVVVNVVKRNFEGFIFTNTEVKYTGDVYTLEVTGELPADVYIYYPRGNSYSEIGEYEVTAILSAPYYVTQEVKATLKIVE